MDHAVISNLELIMYQNKLSIRRFSFLMAVLFSRYSSVLIKTYHLVAPTEHYND